MIRLATAPLRGRGTMAPIGLSRLARRYPQAVARALNRAMQAARTELTRRLREATRITGSRIRRRIRVQPATAQELVARVLISGKGVPAHWFPGLRQTPEGAQYRTPFGTKTEPGAFLARVQGVRQLVLKRKGRPRYPTRLVLGPPLAAIVRRSHSMEESVYRRAREVLRARLSHEMKRVLGGERGAA